MMRRAMALSALLVSGWMALEAATVSGVIREKDSTGGGNTRSCGICWNRWQ